MSITALDISCRTGWSQTCSGIWRSSEYSTIAARARSERGLSARLARTFDNRPADSTAPKNDEILYRRDLVCCAVPGLLDLRVHPAFHGTEEPV